MQERHWCWLKWGCLTLAMGSVIGAALLMWMHGDGQLSTSDSEVSEKSSSSTSVESPLIVERKDERLIWRLKADSAKQQNSIMLLKAPTLELFTESEEIVLVRGDKAWFEPLKRNIHFLGQVNVQYRGWHLSSDDLRFDSARDQVIVPNAFIATGTDIVVKGRGLRIDRKTQHLYVAHDVWVQDSRPDRLGGLP